MNKTDVTFITGNAGKAAYLSRYLGVEIAHKKVELDEIQSMNLDDIVEHKVRQAYDILGSPVLVEDVSLSFKALSGLPGPFVKFFIDYPGLEAMCRMLDGFDSRAALAEAVFAYYDGNESVLFRGGLNGTVPEHPQGEGGYGWDKIFIPEGYTMTRAELSEEDDQKTYLKIKPFAELAKFLEEKYEK
ncbi:Ham1 family protein [candidate division TM7 genomosp. GTL1]|nr:Ham1 family protein [candidate division TM7 genomosp. GTL1]